MKLLLLIFILAMPLHVFSQDMSGIYSPIKRSGDPQGGSTFIITEDMHWGAMAFGTALYGTVEKVSDSLYKFSELKPKSPFSIYSRRNKNLKDSSRMYFSEFTEGWYLMHFDKAETKLPETYDLYNLGASCFSYPALAKLPGIKKSIAMARYGWNDKDGDAYDFYNYCNKKKHNDIAILNNSEVFNKKDIMMVVTDSLIYEPEHPQRGYKKVAKESESLDEMKTYLEQNIEYPDIVYFSNQFYRVNSYSLKNDGWKYNKAEDCYSKMALAEAKLLEDKSDYSEPVILYPYRLISHDSQNTTKIKDLEKSILYSSCGED